MDAARETAIARAHAASALAQQGRVTEAIAAFTAAITDHPELVGARLNLGALLTQQGRCSDALAHLRVVVEAFPALAEGWNNLAMALLQAGDVEAACVALRRARDCRPDALYLHSNLLLARQYRLQADAELAADLAAWRAAALHFAASLPAYQSCRPRSHCAAPDRFSASENPLRIGFVSPDFRLHSVTYFLEPLLAELAAQRPAYASVFLYSDVTQADAVTARLRRLADVWRDCAAMDDGQLLEQLRADQLDVLIDLTGHFEYNRQGVFAARAAPLQLSWLGYPDATHNPGIDYRICDRFTAGPAVPGTPPERVILLPNGHHCYSAPDELPAVAQPPCLSTAGITFGCFNNAFKVSPEIARCWGRILAQLPSAKLLLKARGFVDPAPRARISRWLQEGGATPGQLEFAGRTSGLSAHLKAYHRVDIALDTWPYNGTTTTCEALIMGVPVITLAAGPPAGHVGQSLLHAAGLDEWVASWQDEYIALALQLAADPAALGRCRSRLRQQMLSSQLTHAPSFAAAFVAAMRANLG